MSRTSTADRHSQLAPMQVGPWADRRFRAGRHRPFTPKWRAVVAAAAILATTATVTAPSRADGAEQICQAAAATAARATGVPLDVLQAIALAESGRNVGGQFAPWPWAANLQGAGHWFETQRAALRFVADALNQGARNIDIGCFQINYHWHGSHFRSLEEMFEPGRNALYAARFLARLFDEFGTWEAAAGAYHSRTPALAERYIARLARLRADVSAPTAPFVERAGPFVTGHPPDTGPRHSDSYPLLLEAAHGALGSLVPPGAAPRPGLIILSRAAGSVLP